MSHPAPARNQFKGTVTAVRPGAVNAEVELTTTGGDKIVAVVTQGSVQALGLAVGVPAVAIVKAPWVVVTSSAEGLGALASNHLQGTVSEVTTGAVNDDVAITLPGGTVVHAVVTHGSVLELGLKVGAGACALIKASQVILAA